jgi:ribonuclease VapC
MDASAILAYLQQERGHHLIESLLLTGNCLLTTVNLSETLAKLIDRGLPPPDAQQVVASLNLTIIPFDEPLAQLAAQLRPATRRAGASLGDRACLALAKSLHATAHTTDNSWHAITLPGLTINIIR